MKSLRYLFLLLVLFACNDGNFDRPEFEFFAVSIGNCNENTLLFKINGSEALALTLSGADIKNEESTLLVPISTTRTVIYRLFDATVSASYFCQNIPPTSPSIIQNWTSTGSISISSTEVLDDQGISTGNFLHQINLINLVLTNEDGGTLSYDDYDFGVYQTAITN